MPIYLYEVIDTGETFEQLQGLAEPALTRHPSTGRPVRRVITTPNLPLKYGDRAMRTGLDDRNLARLGFTKYQRNGKGSYEKTTGPSTRGPDQLHSA